VRILNLDATYFIEPLREMGHEVLTVGRGPEYDLPLTIQISLKALLARLEERGFRPEAVLWCDRCEPPSVTGFEALPVPLVGYSVDQYCNPWHVPYSAAFDLMLVAQKDYVCLFDVDKLPRPVEWFPLFCDAVDQSAQASERDIPVSFVGTISGRINTARKVFLNDFRRLCPVFLHQGRYHEAFVRSCIVLNQCAAVELNFRIFQAAATGAAVLTEDVNHGLRDLFEPGRDILVYPCGDAAAAAAVARQWLGRPEALADLARAGREVVLAGHTAHIRAQHIMDCIGGLARRRAWRWRLENRAKVRMLIGKAFGMLCADSELPLPDSHRDFYAELASMYLLTD